MSAQTIAEAHAPMEAEYRSEVMAATWGHLAPRKNRTYTGRIVWAVGCFGSDSLNPTAIVCVFKGLDSSPWFYDALQDFIDQHANTEGCVYEFHGTFRNYEWDGQITKLLDANDRGEP